MDRGLRLAVVGRTNPGIRLRRFAWALLGLVWLVFGVLPAARAADAEITSFELLRDDGLLLNYTVNVELSHGVEDALGKAVPLYFVAEAEVFRSRWYWRDSRVAHAVRVWKIVFQPLTSTYRVTLGGGLSQNFDSRDEALNSITRGSRWKISEAGQLEGGADYVEFSYRLDTSLLPRPMQIGIDGQADWAIAVRRTQRINP